MASKKGWQDLVSSDLKCMEIPGICCHRIESSGKIILIRALHESCSIEIVSHQQLVMQGHACMFERG